MTGPAVGEDELKIEASPAFALKPEERVKRGAAGTAIVLAGGGEWLIPYAPGKPMAVLDGVMKTAVQLMGQAGITGDRMYHHYGTDEVAKEHAFKFQEGDPMTNQPPRNFWGFTSQAYARMDAECDARFVTATS